MAENESNPAMDEMEETPEDVAILYAWANMHGAKYRDFSASKREYRAQLRQKALQAQREEELKAAREREEKARAEEEKARQAAQVSAVDQRRAAEAAEAALRAQQSREEAARHAQAAEAAEKAAREAELEAAGARRRAEEQAKRYAESESRRKAHAGPQPSKLPGEVSDPYLHAGHLTPQQISGGSGVRSSLTRSSAERKAFNPADAPTLGTQSRNQSAEKPYIPVQNEWIPPRRPEYEGRQAAQERAEVAMRERVREERLREEAAMRGRNAVRREAGASPDADPRQSRDPEQSGWTRSAREHSRGQLFASEANRAAASQPRPDTSGARPAWLYNEQDQRSTAVGQDAPLNDTLQHSREQVAARWFALKELMGQPLDHAEMDRSKHLDVVVPPTVMIMSLAGGVGKTSLTATLGRTLSAMGEKVLLAGVGEYGMLPYYFGARELRSGMVRTFSPPAGSPDAPVYMVNYESERLLADQDAQEQVYGSLVDASRGVHRILLDLSSSSLWLARRIAAAKPTILVPLAPDMNSVFGIQSMERMLGSAMDQDGHSIQPFYVLNQFDASLPLHLDVREALRTSLGDRLLPTVIRRAPAVAEALAEGMTVMDYAPNSPVAEDYTQLAQWIRSMVVPATSVFRGMRWSEEA